jgi:hypothetical protein
MASVDLGVSWAAGPVSDPGRYRLAHGTDPATGTEGGQGCVWCAERSDDRRRVALKQLTDMRPEEWPFFQARAHLIGRITHPNLVGHVETFLGPALHDGTPPPPEDFDLHRDIKPSNVRISDGRAVLIDLGIARPLDGSSITRHVGSLGWMPPEMIDGECAVGPASDAWQVAGLAWWAVTGRPPGARRDATGRAALLRSALAPLGQAPARRITELLLVMLADSPGDRPADLAGWCDDLVAAAARPRRRAGAAEPTIGCARRARREPPPPHPRRGPRSRLTRTTLTIAALALAPLLLAGGAVAPRRGPVAEGAPMRAPDPWRVICDGTTVRLRVEGAPPRAEIRAEARGFGGAAFDPTLVPATIRADDHEGFAQAWRCGPAEAGHTWIVTYRTAGRADTTLAIVGYPATPVTLPDISDYPPRQPDALAAAMPPWTTAPARPDLLPADILDRLRRADPTEPHCPVLAPSRRSDGQDGDATLEQPSPGEWFLWYPVPDGGAGNFGLWAGRLSIGAAVVEHWTAYHNYDDGSALAYGPGRENGLQGLPGKPWIAHLAIASPSCHYLVFSYLGEQHLHDLLAGLRIVTS